MASRDEKKRHAVKARVKPAPWAAISQGNPIEKVKAKFNDLSTKTTAWMEKQPAPVEIGLATIGQGIQGAFIGALMGQLTGDLTQQMGTEGQVPGQAPGQDVKLDSMKAIAGGPMVQAKNFAVITGVNQGISTALKRYRKGKDDLLNQVLPAFGSGAAFSLVSGVGTDSPGGKLRSALSSGVGFAVFQGALYQVGQRFSPKPQDDLDYIHTRRVLQDLGLEKYEKNLKRGQLNDRVLPLLTDSSLKDVHIPPGPRLLILEAVHRRRQESAPRKVVVPAGKTVMKP
ncbi:hypothetical protein KFL_004830010 [Klebsormidium nitens]|uniref:SAM domain-containing protein n=1 Tax=Klebsormidium nitens TaxID=105231 RepID=A0A1Y1IDQ2_KLENI|nr:hypothetical protein KFL_004830010 [Klebsormidium nitens]|eukprot:GAQ89050.1 hypothetical protein KFL_004830010 [Klebsormidium nitens]